MTINLPNPTDPNIWFLVGTMSTAHTIIVITLLTISIIGLCFGILSGIAEQKGSNIIFASSLIGFVVFSLITISSFMGAGRDSTAYTNKTMAENAARHKSFTFVYNAAKVHKDVFSHNNDNGFKKIIPSPAKRALNNNELKIATKNIVNTYHLKLTNSESLYPIINANNLTPEYLKKNGVNTIINGQTYACAPVNTITYNPIGEPTSLNVLGISCLENNKATLITNK